MQFDLNRFSLDANFPVQIPRLASSIPDIAPDSFVVTQDLAQITPEPPRERTTRLSNHISNQPAIFLVSHHGSSGKGVRIPSLAFGHDILLSISSDVAHNVSPTVEVSPPGTRDPWDIIEGLVGTIDGPTDWSSQHDHYLYGTPKR